MVPAVGGVELAQIAGDALLKLRPAPLHLRAREVPAAIVHRLELAAIDGNSRLYKQTHLSAEFHEAPTNLANSAAVVLAEIGDRLVVGDEATKEPHHFRIATGLAFKPPARLHPVEIAVDVELQESRGMVGGPPSLRRLDFEP
jgi:hypothetical protein